MSLTAASAGNDKAIDGFPLDALLITEATFIAGALNQAAKFAFARERPFVHFLPRGDDGARSSDDNLSFFSGHTTLAFALATSAGTVSTMRGYSLAPVVWASGLSLAVSVGYLRVAADQHYLTGVLTGAAVGTVIGVGVPLLFHSPYSSSSSASAPGATGQALSAPPVRSVFSVNGAF